MDLNSLKFVSRWDVLQPRCRYPWNYESIFLSMNYLPGYIRWLNNCSKINGVAFFFFYTHYCSWMRYRVSLRRVKKGNFPCQNNNANENMKHRKHGMNNESIKNTLFATVWQLSSFILSRCFYFTIINSLTMENAWEVLLLQAWHLFSVCVTLHLFLSWYCSYFSNFHIVTGLTINPSWRHTTLYIIFDIRINECKTAVKVRKT